MLSGSSRSMSTARSSTRPRLNCKSSSPHTILSRRYANPFSPETRLTFSVPVSQQVSVELFDVEGRRVKTLHTGPAKANEHNPVSIDGVDLPSGTYFVHLRGRGFVASRTVTLVK